MLCALACSRSHEESDAEPSPYADVASIEDWARVFAAQECQRAFRCPLPIEDQLTETFLWRDEEQCVAGLERYIDGGSFFISPFGPLAELQRLEADGRIRIDHERVQACHAAYDGCGVRGAEAGACVDVFEGERLPGETCELSVECQGDAYCAFAEAACPGRCTPRKSVGEECESWIECTSDGWTDCRWTESEDDALCTLIETGTASGEGERCTLGGESVVACPAGLWCKVIEPDVYSGTCQRPIPSGEPCRSRNDVCETGALCLGPEGDMHCRQGQPVAAWEFPDSSGARSCRITDSGRYCDFNEGWFCVEGICEQLHDASVFGLTCLSNGVSCGPDFFCDDRTNTCMRRQPAGVTCTVDAECDSSNCLFDEENAEHRCAERFCEGTW